MKFSTSLASLKETMLSIKVIKPGRMSHRSFDYLSVHAQKKSVVFKCTGIDVTVTRKLDAVNIFTGEASLSILQLDSFIKLNIKKAKAAKKKLSAVSVNFEFKDKILKVDSEYSVINCTQEYFDMIQENHLGNRGYKRANTEAIRLSSYCLEMWDLHSLFCSDQVPSYRYPIISMTAEEMTITGTNGHMATAVNLDFAIESTARSLKHFEDALDDSFVDKLSNRKALVLEINFKLTKLFGENDADVTLLSKGKLAHKLWCVSFKDETTEVMVLMSPSPDYNHRMCMGIDTYKKRKVKDHFVREFDLHYTPTTEHVIFRISDMLELIEMAREYSHDWILVKVNRGVNNCETADVIEIMTVPKEEDCVFQGSLSVKEAMVFKTYEWVFRIDSFDRVMTYIEDDLGWCEMVYPCMADGDNQLAPIIFRASTGMPHKKMYQPTRDFAVIMPSTNEEKARVLKLIDQMLAEEDG